MNISDFEQIRGRSVYARMIETRSPRLADFLREHHLGEPVSVEYRPHSGSEMANCFRNVEAQVQRAKGQMETGWAFKELVDVSIHTVAHAVWVTKFGRRADITPWRFPPKHRILFLPDPKVAIKRGYTAGYRTVYATDARIRAIELFEGELERIFDEHFVAMGQYMDISASVFREAAERLGLPWELASERVEQALENYGH
jgi:hypothetical protein